MRLSLLGRVLLLCAASLNVLSLSHAQSQVVTGTVTDAQSSEALPGVNIVVQGATVGTSTDGEGAYQLNVPSLRDTLVFSYVGYRTQEVPIDGRTTIDVDLQVQTVTGEELVVVGYGTQREENLTGAVNAVDGAELAEQPAMQTSAALMGKAAGVTVTQNSGQPGESQGTIRIRGIGTLGGGGKNNPLVLIDGVPGDIDDVPASDIESVSVLKDAASASIYGSRAANGVILVTTKRGAREGFRVTYSGRLGTHSSIDQPEYVEGGEFLRLENMGATNLGKEPVWSQEYIEEWEANHETDPDTYPNSDWVGDVFSETPIQMQHVLGVSGSADKVRYRGSMQYEDETAEIKNFRFQRYSLRLNTDVTVSDELSFNFDVNALRRDQKAPSSGLSEITRQAYRIPPVYAARWTNGDFGSGWNGQNPLAQAQVGGLSTDETSIFRGRLQADYTPIAGLSLRVMYAPEYRDVLSRDMNKQFRIFDPETGELLHIRPPRNSLFQNTSRGFTNNVNLTATYQWNLADHRFDVLGGYELIDFRNDYFNASRDNFALQDFEQLNAGSQGNQQNGGSAAEYTLQSGFGRLNYSFRDKYLLEANLRYDGSSRFIGGNTWGVFPAFSAGWRLSEEPFLQSAGFLSELKLRGSWGKLGNQEIGNYPFAALVNLGQNFLFGGSVADGAAPLDLANADISWEETTTTNVGLDAAFWGSRLDLTFDWFTRTTDDILLQLPIPLIVGLNAPFQNAGEVQNTGWELSLGYRDALGDDLTYSASFNLSDIKNEVTDLKGAGPFISGSSITQEGSPINSIYGYEADGLFDSQEEIDNHATQAGQIAPGDIRYVDQNGDGAINADDRVVIGNPFPNFSYGLNLSAAYRGVDVSAFVQGVGSQDVLLQGDAVWALQNAGKVTTWQAEQFWTPEKPDDDYPRLTQTTDHNNFRTSSFWVYDASYLRLRSLQVGYTIPAAWSKAISASKLRVYLVGQNLLTAFDNMPPGIDPHVPNNTTGAFYPVQRLYSAGINLTF